MIDKSLAHFQITERLGAGGMGEVYRARDTRLGRDVAIKVLPPEFSSDTQRLARFKREAALLASFNHPNVATVYGLEHAEGVDFLAMELVEGSDLAGRLAGGPLPQREALAICAQVAAGLDAAHQSGIVHRDLKPGNIRVTEEGTAKVLDFGLAKAFEADPESTDISNSPTLMGTGPTAAGIILGTAAYMSPEQARGKPVDVRTDIWAFGCVLYECLTGALAFYGETVTDTLAKILEREPEWERLPATTTPAVRHLLERCLAKDPDRRWRSIGDVLLLIEDALSGAWHTGPPGEEEASAPRASKTRAAKWWAAGTAFLLVAVALWTGGQLFSGSGAEAPGTTGAPQMTFYRLTLESGTEFYPQLSPNGDFLVFEASPHGDTDIFLQRVGGQNPINLTKGSEADDRFPAFSPDGQRIAFRSTRRGGGIFVMGSTGESVRRVCDFGSHPDWSPDGTKLVVADEAFVTPWSRDTESYLWIVDVETGERRQVTDHDAVQPRWSPNGLRIAYWNIENATGGQRDIFTIRPDGTDRVPVTQDGPIDWNPVWSPDGRYLYFASYRGGSANIWRVPIDESTGETLGPPEAITTPSEAVGGFYLSRDGRQIVYSNLSVRTTIERLEFDPVTRVVGRQTSLTKSTIQIADGHVSPDGALFGFRARDSHEDVYLVRTDGTGIRKLTDDPSRDRGINWSPDGQRIICYSDRSGRYELWTMQIDGSGLERLTQTTGEAVWYPEFSPDGSELIAHNGTGTFVINTGEPPIELDETLRISSVAPNGGIFLGMKLSPDGRRIAGVTITAHGDNLRGFFLCDLDTGAITELLDFATTKPYMDLSHITERVNYQGFDWFRDGRHLALLSGNRLLLVDAETGETRTLADDLVGDTSHLSMPNDESAFYFVTTTAESDIWLATVEGR